MTSLKNSKQNLFKYFSSLFRSSNPSASHIENILASIEARVNDRMNGILNQNFTKEEVRTTMFQMNPHKAPGPYGFPISFYQTHGDLIGDLVADFCLNILNEGGDVSAINHTYIALIPKIKNPKKQEIIAQSVCAMSVTRSYQRCWLID